MSEKVNFAKYNNHESALLKQHICHSAIDSGGSGGARALLIGA